MCRTPPDFEVEAVVSALRHLFSCDVAELPVELLTHGFFKQFPLNCTKSYRKCLHWHHLYKQCSDKLHRRCLVRFGSDKKTIDMCRTQINRVDTSAAGILSYVVSHNVSTPVTTTSVDTEVYNEALKFVNALVEIDSHPKSQTTKKDIRKTTEDQIEESEFHISDYVRCLKTKARKLLKCLPQITRSCTSSNLRVIKIVRGEIRDVDALMRASRNFRLVHLIRDPRGVVNSRRQLSSYRSISVNENNMEPEAYYYCADVMRDIRLRRQLEAKHPGRTLQVIYDDFVKNAQEQVRQIYESLLERPLPADVAVFINTTRPRKASSWKAKLNETVVQQIDTACKGLYEMLSESGNIFNQEHEMG
ncbi:hypothetical protein LSAT2_019409 [Lamellibrachia satsuma]|nr:hypothetical protein LSAT2_019409 [Lamellibrachia satsuma]